MPEVATYSNEATKMQAERVEHLIRELSPIKIDVFLPWVPTATRREVMDIVERSPMLNLIGDTIHYTEGVAKPCDDRSDSVGLSARAVPPFEAAPAYQTPGAVLKPKPQSMPSNEGPEITLDEVVDLIERYNDQVERKYKEVQPGSPIAKRQAICSYLSGKYDVEYFYDDDLFHIYTLSDKDNHGKLGYLVILEDIDPPTMSQLKIIIGQEMAFIYYTGQMHGNVDEEETNIFIKSAKAIVTKNIERYRLDKVQKLLLKILKE